MSTTVALPASLRGQLAAVARRVRRLRAARGLALTVLTLALGAAAALLADYLFDLPARARRVRRAGPAVRDALAGRGAVRLRGQPGRRGGGTRPAAQRVGRRPPAAVPDAAAGDEQPGPRGRRRERDAPAHAAGPARHLL